MVHLPQMQVGLDIVHTELDGLVILCDVIMTSSYGGHGPGWPRTKWMLHKSESAWIIWLVHLQAYICVAMFIVQIYSYFLFRHHLPGCYYCSSHSCQCSSQSFLCLWMFTHDRWTSLGGCIQHYRSAWQNGRSVYYSISNTADLHDKMEDQNNSTNKHNEILV